MKKLITSFLFGLIVSTSLFSQLTSYNFQSASSTYSAETGGIILGNAANDEQVFNNNTTGETAPQTDIGFPIGFNFYYNGSTYNRFAVNTNGWILLGTGSFTIGKTSAPISYSSTEGFANIISALGRDLQGQAGSELSYKLTGSEPNRILIVQWLNYRRYNIASGESFNFQIKLYESDNSISFTYGNVITTNTSSSSANNPTQVGLRGAVNSDFKNRTSTSSWSSSSAGTLNTSTMRLTAALKPASGLEYKWSQSNMSYSSSTTLSGENSTVRKNSANNVIIKVQILTTGSTAPISATSITFNTAGSTNVSDISNAKVWFTGLNPVFSSSQQFGSVVNNPSGSFSVSGNQLLQSGANYFWLTYDVPLTAETGNHLDAECNSVTVSIPRIPVVQSPGGFSTITNSPLNGYYTIGLGLFELAAGKDLYFKKSIRKVTREFATETNINFLKKSQKDDADVSAGNKKEFRETSEDTYVLMEGSFPYTGPACIELTEDLQNKMLSKGIPDGTEGIYPSISAAFNDLSQRGLDGPVTFLLVDNIYSSETFPIVLSELHGSSAVNTFTLKPSPGISPQIAMSSGSSVIKIYNSQYITIDGSNTVGGVTRDLSIISNDANISYGIWIGSKSGTTMRDITVKNCIIKTGENSLGSTPILIADGNNSSAAGLLNNVSVINNVFQKGRQGIFVNGGTTPQGITNLTINGNIINSTGADAMGFMGIYVQGVNTGVIRSNDIGNLNTSANENDKGIWVANGSHSVKVDGNKIYNIGYTGSNGYGGHGIYLSANHVNAYDTICNNVIYNMYGDGWNFLDQIYYLDNPVGIALYSSTPQSGISLLNNSINLYGNTLLGPNSASFGVFASTNTAVSILNNVISNNLGVGIEAAYGSCGVYAQNSVSQFGMIDYNNYYINPTGTGVKAIGKISGANTFTSLNSWRSVTLQDRSSINYNPGFTSNTDLLPDVNSSNSWSLNGRGKQNLSVNNDFNGNPRSVTLPDGAPDIGAYEFTPVSQPPSISGIGAISDGGSTLYLFGSDTVASIVWHGADLPTALTLKYFSGTNPPSPTAGNYGNCYWLFEPTGGSGYTFDITLFWDPAAIGAITGVNNITIANYTSGVWEHYDAAVNTSARNVTKNGLTKLTTFTIDDFDNPMPVTMLYFNHSVEIRNVILKWASASEINNKGFEIERSSEFNSVWEKIGFVIGKGNSNTEINYEYKDLALATGKYNYRLKQIDYTGNAEYFNLSDEVVIGKPVNFSIGQNYPNPSNPKAMIDYQLAFDTKLSIKVYDILGREVKTLFEGFSEAGYYSIEFDGTSLASGIYFYRIVSAYYAKSMKLILVK